MTNPQLTENLLAVIRSLPADDRRWLLRQLEQDTSDLSHGALAEMAMAGGAFDDLAAESDLYSFSDGEAIVAG
ncbi:hypothetical protein [Synechococcus sp. CBW1108]|jgi:hypothetical protein|uniref:hypothetical protein n=1 Tax=Synechococcus sp. CBW1108 TaxID=1353147 RepID=UPI0018CF3A8A|nr:hypothetical protein [Synechococcus sp. CBW1108]QPN69976.1 hypothetical protein H8F27_16340 [Synechococcus sp. CBW1108]